jgi:hypothetical protein
MKCCTEGVDVCTEVTVFFSLLPNSLLGCIDNRRTSSNDCHQGLKLSMPEHMAGQALRKERWQLGRSPDLVQRLRASKGWLQRRRSRLGHRHQMNWRAALRVGTQIQTMTVHLQAEVATAAVHSPADVVAHEGVFGDHSVH